MYLLSPAITSVNSNLLCAKVLVSCYHFTRPAFLTYAFFSPFQVPCQLQAQPQPIPPTPLWGCLACRTVSLACKTVSLAWAVCLAIAAGTQGLASNGMNGLGSSSATGTASVASNQASVDATLSQAYSGIQQYAGLSGLLGQGKDHFYHSCSFWFADCNWCELFWIPSSLSPPPHSTSFLSPSHVFLWYGWPDLHWLTFDLSPDLTWCDLIVH